MINFLQCNIFEPISYSEFILDLTTSKNIYCAPDEYLQMKSLFIQLLVLSITMIQFYQIIKKMHLS